MPNKAVSGAHTSGRCLVARGIPASRWDALGGENCASAFIGGCEKMAKLDDAQRRSAVIAERIRQRTDVALRRTIANFEGDLSFLPLPDLMISEAAWKHVTSSDIDPKLVFAHPDLLRQNPRASEYYRGIALLPRKRVAEIAGAVDSWEDENRRTILREPHILRVARLYNAVISSIIEGSNG